MPFHVPENGTPGCTVTAEAGPTFSDAIDGVAATALIQCHPGDRDGRPQPCRHESVSRLTNHHGPRLAPLGE